MRGDTIDLRHGDLRDSHPIHHRAGYGNFRCLVRFLYRSADYFVDSGYRIRRYIHRNTIPTHFLPCRIGYSR